MFLWERGLRTPGLEEIKQVARVLNVSPAYLMGLTDRKTLHPLEMPHVGALIPLLNHKQACDPRCCINNIKKAEYDEPVSFIPISVELAKKSGNNLFALEIEDESMKPELLPKDVIIVSVDAKPNPGNFIVAKIDGNDEVIVRRYKLLSASSIDKEFELLAMNEHWPDIKSDTVGNCVILGTVISLHRELV